MQNDLDSYVVTSRSRKLYFHVAFLALGLMQTFPLNHNFPQGQDVCLTLWIQDLRAGRVLRVSHSGTLCFLGCESVSCSVLSNSLRPHGL